MKAMSDSTILEQAAALMPPRYGHTDSKCGGQQLLRPPRSS
jgi:hypothetical protein